MIVTMDMKNFTKTMNNVVDYSLGFVDGIERGKKVFLDKLGKGVVFALGKYIDVMSSANSPAMHHVYEWYQTGSPSARLFDIDYIVNKNGLSLFSNFKQSRTLSEDATVPFYNKAKIMESGQAVVIRPRPGSALRFRSGGEDVFTKRSVTVRNPGGDQVQGSFQQVFNEFMTHYFKQSFIRASGLYDYLNNPSVYKKNIAAGSKMGRSKGVSTGFNWIVNARIGVE